MERNDEVKNNQFRSNSAVIKNYLFKTNPKKVVLECHYIVPWEMADSEDYKVTFKKKDEI